MSTGTPAHGIESEDDGVRKVPEHAAKEQVSFTADMNGSVDHIALVIAKAKCVFEILEVGTEEAGCHSFDRRFRVSLKAALKMAKELEIGRFVSALPPEELCDHGCADADELREAFPGQPEFSDRLV